VTTSGPHPGTKHPSQVLLRLRFVLSHHLSSPDVHPVQSDTKSRNSATAGNGIGIHSMQVQVRTSSVKPKSTSAETIAGFSDGDDSVERESILQSLAKGMQRVSSGVGLCILHRLLF